MPKKSFLRSRRVSRGGRRARKKKPRTANRRNKFARVPQYGPPPPPPPGAYPQYERPGMMGNLAAGAGVGFGAGIGNEAAVKVVEGFEGLFNNE